MNAPGHTVQDVALRLMNSAVTATLQNNIVDLMKASTPFAQSLGVLHKNLTAERVANMQADLARMAIPLNALASILKTAQPKNGET